MSPWYNKLTDILMDDTMIWCNENDVTISIFFLGGQGTETMQQFQFWGEGNKNDVTVSIFWNG
jgi:hypothetical protein